MKKYASMFYLLAANLASVLIGVICIPILARIYTPGQFGEWSIVISLSAILTIITTLQFEHFIPGLRYRYQVSALALSICGFSLVSCTVFGIGGWVLAVILGHQAWLPMLWLSLGMMLLLAVNQTLQFLLTRSRSYKTLANRQLFFVLMRFSLQFYLGLRAIPVLLNGMVTGDLATRFLQIGIVNVAQMKRLVADGRRLWQTRSFLPCYIARHWLKKGLHATGARLLGDGPYLLLSVAIGLMYSIDAVGQFNIAHNAVLSVINALWMVVSSVFLGESFKYYHTDKPRFRRYFFQTVAMMSLLGISMYVFSLLYAKQVIDLIFHSAWKDVYTYFMILLPTLSIQLALGATSTLLTTMHKPHYMFAVNALWNILFWPLVLFCYFTGAPVVFFLWGFGYTVIVRYVVNFILTAYWVMR